MIKSLPIFLLFLFIAIKGYAGSCPTKDEAIQILPDKKLALMPYAKNTGWTIVEQDANPEILAETFVEAEIYYNDNAETYRVYCNYYTNQILTLTIKNNQTDIDLNSLKKFQKTKYDLAPGKAYHEYDVYYCSANINEKQNCPWSWKNDD